MYQLQNSHSLTSMPPPLAKLTETTVQTANRMMYLEEDQSMMKQDLEFLGINPLDDFSSINNRRNLFIKLVSKLVKQVEVIELQMKEIKPQLQEIATVINQLEYCLGEQSEDDDEDLSCSIYYDS